MQELTLIQKLAIFILPLIFAITVHEAAHGWMAKRLGDKTAEMLGRVTLNPIKHIDPIGTILVPLGVYVMTGFMFGWAKPVPVNWNNLRQPKRDMGLVALAGPGANLIMALIWALLVYAGALMLAHFQWLAVPLILMGVAGVLFNAILMALNLLPVPPLDGGRIVYSLLPPKQAQAYSRLESFGLFIVLFLLVTGLLSVILGPVVGLTIMILPASDIVAELIPVILSPARS
ncbi:MAG: site-2 protease family protein [gamma proteobacterium symbiont of Ctena orbiculata]|uniref:Site-2 protease family protein n=1 Tax=Candidatus Thiodiazotropha taylori TaxID=2792791 RepID=A0A944MF34_9GAMM|nr:site-2 protease family protein [Candidatus Thiodiazotropha taylori]PUB89720.1 MAG: site-2 protease family protein [gamma proteobacterium symbiont of Ctena orbiculata]MBT2990222.1 site-2 protease family protein [Candidatus Thiodiazotropha taylori]MBT2997828.1 site-2 protease family protein [Candidatus Thiodiazotropha taylori]MBT3000403.1 site-2 protease family protein [Candidatus Thiodiazotropha taylori]